MRNERSFIQRLLGIPLLVVAIAAVLAAGLMTASASAATATPTVNANATARSGIHVIKCTPQVQNPHDSTHKPGSVNVVVTLKCTAKVSRLVLRAALYRNGVRVKESRLKTVNNAKSAQNNAAVTPCRKATYRGWGVFEVVFPPHYVPHTAVTSGFGRSVPVPC